MDDEELPYIEMGRGETGRECEQEAELPAAIIYLPDPDTRRGWSTRWVMRVPKKQAARAMGFGKRGLR